VERAVQAPAAAAPEPGTGPALLCRTRQAVQAGEKERGTVQAKLCHRRHNRDRGATLHRGKQHTSACLLPAPTHVTAPKAKSKHTHTQPPGAAPLHVLGRLTQPHAWDARGSQGCCQGCCLINPWPGSNHFHAKQPTYRQATLYTACRLSRSGLQTAAWHSRAARAHTYRVLPTFPTKRSIPPHRTWGMRPPWWAGQSTHGSCFAHKPRRPA
jgi:hypothetical protein